MLSYIGSGNLLYLSLINGSKKSLFLSLPEEDGENLFFGHFCILHIGSYDLYPVVDMELEKQRDDVDRKGTSGKNP